MTDDQRKMIQELQNYAPEDEAARLSNWEIKFLASVEQWQGDLTPPQQAKLADIWEKCFG